MCNIIVLWLVWSPMGHLITLPTLLYLLHMLRGVFYLITPIINEDQTNTGKHQAACLLVFDLSSLVLCFEIVPARFNAYAIRAQYRSAVLLQWLLPDSVRI